MQQRPRRHASPSGRPRPLCPSAAGRCAMWQVGGLWGCTAGCTELLCSCAAAVPPMLPVLLSLPGAGVMLACCCAVDMCTC